MMKKKVLTPVCAALLSIGMIGTIPVLAKDAAKAPATQSGAPAAQSPATKSVQAAVDKQSASKAAAKRQDVVKEAVVAIAETENALRALNAGKKDEALAALEKATGKLELVLARDPALALAPVDVEQVTFDLLADTKTIKALIYDAEKAIKDGEIQQARAIMMNLASEIVFRTTSIPLATYPDAIKAITPLIDAGKIDEAKQALRAALSTLVISEDIIPLPVLRADYMLAAAKTLSENMERSDEDNKLLERLLKSARVQLQLAEALGYGNKKLFKPLYKEIDEIERKTAGGKGGKGWFDSLEKKLDELMS